MHAADFGYLLVAFPDLDILRLLLQVLIMHACLVSMVLLAVTRLPAANRSAQQVTVATSLFMDVSV